MNEELAIQERRNKQVDEFEALLLSNYEPGFCHIRDIFTDGLYAREMTIAADQWITSKIHKTEFIFVVSKGKLLVSMDNNEEVTIEAPYTGISKPNSRRVAYIVEDTIWTTFHANPNNETVDEIEERIIEKHDNALLTDEMKEKLININRKVINTLK
jgi:hypothetical protein